MSKPPGIDLGSNVVGTAPCGCKVVEEDGDLVVVAPDETCSRFHTEGQHLLDPETGEWDVDGAGQAGC